MRYFGGNAAELPHYFFEAAVEAVHCIQVKNLVVGLVTNQRDLLAFLLLSQVVVACDPVEDQNRLFCNMVAQGVHDVFGTRLRTVDTAGNHVMVAVSGNANAHLFV